LTRETYDRGNGAVILPCDPLVRRRLLARQFRVPAFVSGCDDFLIEAPAGLLDEAAPEGRVRAEQAEELPPEVNAADRPCRTRGWGNRFRKVRGRAASVSVAAGHRA
tara:strand:+ start:892 stop:1212 length:321 start_codon:yes stop_codon:yes gene_type:complete